MKTAVITGLVFTLLVTSCSNSDKEKIDTQEEESMYLKEGENVDPQTYHETNWDEVDVTSPIVRYEEITSDDIEVRGTDDYSVYTMDETILFDFDKAEIRDSGEDKLGEVVRSMEKRFPDGEVAVRGYTDAVGTKDYNKDLARERAEAVADYLEENADIASDQITVLARGEKNPVATNETAEGRQQNRRVEIIVRND